MGFFCGGEASGIVATRLSVSCSPAYCADVMIFDQNFYRVKTFGIIRADRREDDKEEITL
jgi:hypothetical protein